MKDVKKIACDNDVTVNEAEPEESTGETDLTTVIIFHQEMGKPGIMQIQCLL